MGEFKQFKGTLNVSLTALNTYTRLQTYAMYVNLVYAEVTHS